jgi:hypothetical protein
MCRKPLPLELVSLVATSAADAGDTRTIAAIARVSHAVNDVVTPILYRRLVLTRRNAANLFRGLKRAAEPKDHSRTKADYDADLATFTREFGGVIEKFTDGEGDGLDGGDWPGAEWQDSDPETDDELSADWAAQKTAGKRAIKAEPKDEPMDVPTGDDAAWERRCNLLKHCRHLTILQVPSRPLLEDLLSVVNAGSDDEDEDDSDDDSEDDSEDDGENASEKANKRAKENAGSLRRNAMLFPNVTHLAVGSRVLRYTSDYYAREIFQDPIHDFLGFLKRAFNSPKHICFTCPRELPTLTPEYLMRVFRKPADSIDPRESPVLGRH